MIHDLLIIGGGINGTAIARDAAIGGASVLLVEKDDLAAHTSSASTKLIHGGLRYLEYYEFKLVREALKERERLLRAAPHLIYPMHFVLPHENAVRPWWLVRLGLFLYDTIGGRITLPRSRSLRKLDAEYLKPLQRPGKGFVYSDAWVDDARLVVLNAIDASKHGAEIATQTALISARLISTRLARVPSNCMTRPLGPTSCKPLAATSGELPANANGPMTPAWFRSCILPMEIPSTTNWRVKTTGWKSG